MDRNLLQTMGPSNSTPRRRKAVLSNVIDPRITDKLDGTPDYMRKFAQKLQVDLILPDHPEYDSIRRVWNHAYDQRPRAIALCLTEEDIVDSLELAQKHGLTVAVRSGGHSFAGYGACDDGLVVNLSRMKRVEIDQPAKTVRIAPGIRAGDLDKITQAFDLAVPLGSCPSVAVAGYALGGGEGSLTPRFGYACDSIQSASIITADGRRLRASQDENDDLFRAIRGGGGNFGVVTSIDFRLYNVNTVLSGHLKYPISRARGTLRFIDEYVLQIPEELYIVSSVFPRPGERMLDIGVVWSGEPREGERVLRPLRQFGNPLEDSIAVRPYLVEQQSGSDSPAEGDWCSHRRAGHLQRLGAEAIEIISDHCANGPTETCGITITYWHGRWSSQPRDDAFGFRQVGYEYWIHTYWQDPADREKSYAWVDKFHADLRPFSTSSVYVNDLEREGESRIKQAYGSKYERLARIKRKYDPNNFFHMNQNIAPA